MRKTETIKVYNLVNANGTRLRLELGRTIDGLRDEYPIDSKDNGFRWRFVGKKIPMPVRSEYWFNGFPEEIMLNWLKENGWYPKTCVYMCNGTAHVYELPKGNEDPAPAYELSEAAIRNGKCAMEDAIKMLCSNGYVLKAVSLYRYIHPCTLIDAKHAVDAIRFDNKT